VSSLLRRSGHGLKMICETLAHPSRAAMPPR